MPGLYTNTTCVHIYMLRYKWRKVPVVTHVISLRHPQAIRTHKPFEPTLSISQHTSAGCGPMRTRQHKNPHAHTRREIRTTRVIHFLLFVLRLLLGQQRQSQPHTDISAYTTTTQMMMNIAELPYIVHSFVTTYAVRLRASARAITTVNGGWEGGSKSKKCRALYSSPSVYSVAIIVQCMGNVILGKNSNLKTGIHKK